MTDLPDLLAMLPGHDHARGRCDYRAGYLAALRHAAAYVQDYGHHLDRSDVVRLQAPMLRAVAIAECDECNLHGCVEVGGRHVEHHPLGAPA